MSNITALQTELQTLTAEMNAGEQVIATEQAHLRTIEHLKGTKTYAYYEEIANNNLAIWDKQKAKRDALKYQIFQAKKAA